MDNSFDAPKPAIHVWTMQLARWRLAKNNNIAVLDITAKSGVHVFAPRFEHMVSYKRGELSESEYTELYLARMNVSQQRFPDKWEQLTAQPRVALACYCKAGVFCHRHLFLTLMADYLARKGQVVMSRGELIKEIDNG